MSFDITPEVPRASRAPSCPSPTLAASGLLSVTLGLNVENSVSGMYHVNEITQHVHFDLVSLTRRNYWEILPCFSNNSLFLSVAGC